MTQIPPFFPNAFHKFVGNGSLFKFLKPFETNRFVGFFNSVYNVAPASKWGLSIVPLYGVFQGNPPPEKIDINTSAALATTGFIWTYYATLIQPQNSGSRMLATVNFCMGSVNGFNVYRRYCYDCAEATKTDGAASKK